MYVCICNTVTDSDIRNAADEGVRTMRQLRQKTGCSSTCGSCRELASEILQKSLEESRETPFQIPVMQMA